MLGTKILLYSTLALGGLLFFMGEAKATPKTEPTKNPPPKPTGSTTTAAQRGGSDCVQALNYWSSLADGALVLCRRAAELADEWWIWEEYRIAGEFSYDAAYHEQLRRDWEAAQNACDDANGAALAAMGDYEACMTARGLNPMLPIA